MIFGREKRKEVSILEAERLALDAFEKRTADVKDLGRRSISKILDCRDEFVLGCRNFEKVEAEPYMEDLYGVNPSSIKGQKALYLKNVMHIFENMDLREKEGKTSYETYLSVLERSESAINEVLKTNAAFRTVLYSYSNHMGPMKKAFTAMEKSVSELKKGLDKRRVEFDNYRKIIGSIEKILDFEEEICFLSGSTSEEREHEKIEVTEEKSRKEELEKGPEEKNSEISAISAEISNISGRISLLTAPLGRLARKHDHLSMGKIKLTDFLAEPSERIRNYEDYRIFSSMLEELKENIKGGRVEAKNSEAMISAIEEIHRIDLHRLSSSMRELLKKRLELEADSRILKESLGKSDKKISSIEHAAVEREEGRKRIKELEELLKSEKESLERMFLDYYRIGIILSEDFSGSNFKN